MSETTGRRRREDVIPPLFRQINSIVCLAAFNVCNLIFLALPIAMFVIGLVKRNECPIEPRIPLFLIVAGVQNFFWVLVMFIGSLMKICCVTRISKSSKQKIYVSLGTIFVILSLAITGWIIASSVWIFGKKSSIQYNDSNDTATYCDKLVYMFSFVILIIQFTTFGLICCCVCCASCFGGLAVITGILDED